MCGGTYTEQKDPAVELGNLLYTYAPSNDTRRNLGLRKLIRERWPLLKRLAHAIHDEETNFRRDQRKALAELDDYNKYG